METKYYKFLSNFIVKSKRERLIYELQSEKKRENAFSKMTNFLDCFNSEDIIVDLTHFQDDIAIKRIEEVVSDKDCFDIANRERNLLKSAYLRAVNSYMCNVLVVDEHTIIYIGECEIGASEKYILRK
jgi:hypothetical protein